MGNWVRAGVPGVSGSEPSLGARVETMRDSRVAVRKAGASGREPRPALCPVAC